MDPRLRTSAQSGDLAALTRALDEGADPRLADEDGSTALHYAASNGHVACIVRLAESGADVNAITDMGGVTPLNSAIFHGAAVRALVSLGAAVDWHECVTVPGLIFRNTLPTALHWAVEHGSADAVEALIKAGADLEHDNASRRLVLASEDEATRRAGLAEAGFDVDEIDEICDEINEVADSSDESSDESSTGDNMVDPQRIILGAFTPLDEALARFGTRRHRIVSLLVCAGAKIKSEHEDTSPYLRALIRSGGYAAYAKAHRALLVAILSRGQRLPADVVPRIVDYWAHCGSYVVESKWPVPVRNRDRPRSIHVSPYDIPV